MVTGGVPARKRTVLTLSIGGAVVASVAVGTCCTTLVPPPEQPGPAPEPAADSGAPPAEGGAEAGPICEFASPRARAIARRTPRIVGGKPAADGAYPFAVGLATPSRFQYCAGSVVAERFVVTASHCMVAPGDFALAGSSSLADSRAIRVTESRLHPEYDSGTLDYDVAIAVLEAPAGVQSVPLARGVTSVDATAVGWGLTSEGGSATNFLRAVALPLWDNADCRQSYATLTPRQLCAGAAGLDACQGDSGGPLLSWNIDHWELLGITSFGRGCARPDFPGVFTDVRAREIADWIVACAR